MRGDEAKEHCPTIELVRVASVRGKADLSKYRDAGKEVAAVLQEYSLLLERASVDEAYLDITERVNARLLLMNQGTFVLTPEHLLNSYAIGHENIGDFVQNVSRRMKYETDMDNMDSDELEKYARKNDLKLMVAASIVNEIRAAVKQRTGKYCIIILGMNFVKNFLTNI